MNTKFLIVSLGGSLMIKDDKINTEFLQKFVKLVKELVKSGQRLIIITGGGSTARKYAQGAKSLNPKISINQLDWLGIHSTRLNAYLLQSLLPGLSDPKIILDHTKKIASRYPVIIGGGYKPGWSSDYAMMLAAKAWGVKKVVNISNIDFVYNKDPRKNLDAVPLHNIDWDYMQRLVGTKWVPGLNLPFDPIAVKLGKKLKMEVGIVNGNNISNLKKCLQNKPFTGTVIA
jgi:uridylate kinase